MHCLSKVEVVPVFSMRVEGGGASVASSYVKSCEFTRTCMFIQTHEVIGTAILALRKLSHTSETIGFHLWPLD